jgi:hypothetical protein
MTLCRSVDRLGISTFSCDIARPVSRYALVLGVVAGGAEHGAPVEVHGAAFGDGYQVVDFECFGGAAAGAAVAVAGEDQSAHSAPLTRR